jgi:hypothetical protein
MTRFFLSTFAFIALSASTPVVGGDDPRFAVAEDLTWAELRLSDEPSASANEDSNRRPLSTSARLRQQRALYRDQQRVARIEANAWIGYEPLRPGWSSVPMMSSRFPDRQRIVIPVFVP